MWNVDQEHTRPPVMRERDTRAARNFDRKWGRAYRKQVRSRWTRPEGRGPRRALLEQAFRTTGVLRFGGSYETQIGV
jgi:hypothetical protein